MPTPLFGVLYQSWPQPDGSFRLEFLSADAERLLETTADEFAARWLDRTLPLFGVDVDEFYRTSAESVSQHLPRQAEFGYIGPNIGAIRWFRAHDFPRRTPEGAPFFSGVLIDITELKQNHRQRAALDHELRDARHMESLGLLAGGIAHDFNNLLTIILGNAGVAKMLAGQESPIDKNLGEIETACERAADLCNQITAYAGVGRLLATDLDLDALLREAEESFRTLVGRHADYKANLEPGSFRIVGEGRQLKRAIGNILLNAAEALGAGGGEIQLHTRRVSFEQTPEGFAPAIAPGEYAAIRIVDSGPGMPEAVRARAFDAFFSTKFSGRGLGLAAVFGIVRSHKGGVRILSRPGAGTTVELLLPLKADPVGIGPRDLLPGAADSAQRKILVVDDDANIRELICSVLEDDGYTVLAAADGQDAESLFDGDPHGFRLAVVDLTMPGIGGHELIRRMRLKVDGFPALVVSGYADREMPRDLLDSGPTVVLPKPFRLEQLTAAVKRLTSEARPV